MTIIVGIYFSSKSRRDEKKVRAEIKAIELAIHSYHTDNNYYPPDSGESMVVIDPGTGEEKALWNSGKNGLFASLTQGTQKDKKNYLMGAQVKHDGEGNLIAPLDHPDTSWVLRKEAYTEFDEPGETIRKHKPGESLTGLENYWCYNSSSPEYNPDSFDLWVFLRIEYKKKVDGGEVVDADDDLRVFLGNWTGDFKYEEYKKDVYK